MNGLSTAPWIAAILVNSLDNIEFNNKSRGQAIRFITRTPQSAQSPRPETQYPWSKVLTEVGTRFSTQYPNLKRMSKLPSSGSNVKILTNQSHVHFEWYIKGPVSLKTFEVGLHIEKRNQELNQKILSTLMAHKNEFTKIIGENVFFGPYGTTGKPRNVATKICVTKKFSRINEELIDWAVQSMSKFYNYFNPILNETPL